MPRLPDLVRSVSSAFILRRLVLAEVECGVFKRPTIAVAVIFQPSVCGEAPIFSHSQSAAATASGAPPYSMTRSMAVEPSWRAMSHAPVLDAVGMDRQVLFEIAAEID